MKKLVLTLLALATISNVSAFRANADVYFDRTFGEVTVENELPMPIICSGDVQGITMNGIYVYSYIRNTILYPGQSAFINIYTNNYNPFTAIRPRINCHSI